MRSLKRILAIVGIVALGAVGIPTAAYAADEPVADEAVSALAVGPNFLESSHDVPADSCGIATITLRNVSPWIYPMSVEIDSGTATYGPTVDNRAVVDGKPVLIGPQQDRSATRTLTFEAGSGTHDVRYRVQAGSERDLYAGLPVGEWTEFEVEACPIVIAAIPVEAVVGQPTCAAHEGDASYVPADEGWVTIPETEGVDYYINGGLVVSGVTYRLWANTNNVMTAKAQEGYRLGDDFQQLITIGEKCAVAEEAVYGNPVCTAHEGAASYVPADEGWVTIPETEGVDYYINGGLVVSGETYRLWAEGNNVMTAQAQEGYRLEGEFSQEINISEMPSWLDCNADTLPEPEVTVVENSEVDCDEGTITKWETITTTEWVLNETEDGWVLDTENAEVTETEKVTTDATEEELAECPIVPVEPVTPEEPVTPSAPGTGADGTTQAPSAPSKAGLASTGFGIAPLLLGAGAGMTALGGFLLRRRK